MLEVAAERDDLTNGNMFLWDMGQGLSFRSGTFDGAVSISAVQWLCNADKKENNPVQRINRFFQSLYASLARGARAVLQLYPENPSQVELLTSAAMRAGFGGGLVVDFPNSTRAKKYYLVLWAGTSGIPQKMPEAQTGEEPTSVQYETARLKEMRKRADKGKGRDPIKGRQWVLAKKERQRRQGKDVRPDSKYSGRTRKPRF
jgi:18S rRNA (guanine1575-N7)-methyltransferase